LATRFWLTSSAPPYTPTTRRGAWDVASGEDVQLLGRKPAGSAGTSSINAGSTAADRDVLLHRSISAGAVKAGTISGTVSWTIGVRESNVDCNAVWHVHIYVTSGDSDTPRGTLLSDYIGSTEFTTTATGTQITGQAISSLAIQTGDRLVVEIGYRAQSLSTTYNSTVNYGNTGTTDLTSGSTSVTTAPGWVEFSGMDGLFTSSFSTLTDAFPSSIDSKWTASAGVSATGGRARINCTTAYPNMYTSGAYQIQGSTLAVKVPTVPTAGGGSNVTMSAYVMPGPTVSTTNLEFEYSPNTGNLVLKNNVGGTDASPTTLTYSATDHLWWRFRETGGSIYMETSPDNTTWTTRRTISTMSQWMLQGNHIAYFEAGRSTGTADFGEIDDINPAGQTAALTLASETDTAQALTKSKMRALGISSATDTAQALARTKRLTLGAASETDTGQAAARGKSATLGVAAETATARPLGRVVQLPLASETEAAQALAARKTRGLSAATETDTSQALAGSKRLTAGQAGSSESAVATGQTKTKPVSPATGAEAAQPLASAKHLPLAAAVETSTALAPAAAKTRALVHAAETATARTLTPATPLTAAASTETARPLTQAKTRALSPAAEQDTAQPLSTPGHTTQPLTPATESSTARPLAQSKALALSPVFEYATAPPAGRTKTQPTAYATSSEQAQPLTSVRRLALAPATETSTSRAPDGLTKHRLLTPALETSTAQALATPAAGQAHGIRLTGGPRTTWVTHNVRTAWTCTRKETEVLSQSTEYHEVGVTWTRGDPTTYPVQMAVLPVGHDPDDADWHTATWDTDADGLPVTKLLVGPDGGAVEPVPGRYRDWVTIDAPPEHPVLHTAPYEIE
jgi:hypothetical protein